MPTITYDAGEIAAAAHLAAQTAYGSAPVAAPASALLRAVEEIRPLASILAKHKAGIEASQPLDATLTALAALDNTVGFLKQTGADTFSRVTLTASDISGFAESVDDRVAALLVAGTGVTLTYDDGAGTITIDAAGGGGYAKLVASGANNGTLTLYDDTGGDAGVSTLRVRPGSAQDASGAWYPLFQILSAWAGTALGSYPLVCTLSGENIRVAAHEFVDTSAGTKWLIDADALQLGSGFTIKWGDSTVYYGAPTAGLSQSVAGVVKTTNGGAGLGGLQTGLLAGAHVVNIAGGTDAPFVDIPVTDNTVVAGTLEYAIGADDGTDFQVVSGVVSWAGVNKADTVTTAAPTDVGTPLPVTSSGTLTATFTAVAGTDKITLRCNAVSSLTETSLWIRFRPHVQTAIVVPTPL